MFFEIDYTEEIQKLVKALEAGSYNASPQEIAEGWHIPSRETITKLDLQTAQGAELDKIAEMWGLKRQNGVDPMYGTPKYESDKELRHRVRTTALDDGIGVPFHFDDEDTQKIELETLKLPSGPKCDCGAAALGYTQPGPGHAYWCTIATK